MMTICIYVVSPVHVQNVIKPLPAPEKKEYVNYPSWMFKSQTLKEEEKV